MSKIVGFIVLRRPEFAVREGYTPVPSRDGKLYCGVDRFPWEELDKAYYAKELPDLLGAIRDEMHHREHDFLGLSCLKDLDKAKAVLNFSGHMSEIIAVWSPVLAREKGEFECDLPLQHIGLDCCGIHPHGAAGEWSVIADGVFRFPDVFPEAPLNQWGLLETEYACSKIFDRYVEASLRELVEPLIDSAKAHNINIYRIA